MRRATMLRLLARVGLWIGGTGALLMIFGLARLDAGS